MDILAGDEAAESEALAALRKAHEARAAELAQKEAFVDAASVAALNTAMNAPEFSALIDTITALRPMVDPQRKAQVENILTGLNAMRAVSVNMAHALALVLPKTVLA